MGYFIGLSSSFQVLVVASKTTKNRLNSRGKEKKERQTKTIQNPYLHNRYTKRDILWVYAWLRNPDQVVLEDSAIHSVLRRVRGCESALFEWMQLVLSGKPGPSADGCLIVVDSVNQKALEWTLTLQGDGHAISRNIPRDIGLHSQQKRRRRRRRF